MAEAMKGVTKAMGQMNRQLNLPALQKIMQEFERQNERMEMTTEVMGDAIDDALEGDEEEETDQLVSQVLDEIGVDLDSQVPNSPFNWWNWSKPPVFSAMLCYAHECSRQTSKHKQVKQPKINKVVVIHLHHSFQGPFIFGRLKSAFARKTRKSKNKQMEKICLLFWNHILSIPNPVNYKINEPITFVANPMSR